MKHFAFKTIVENQLDRSREVLLGKAEEYSSAQDRLHNFRVAAKLQGVSEKEALGGMMSKHTVSIFDMIRDDEDISVEMWDEKITDHINYLLLLRALVEEGFRDLPKDSINYQDKPAFPPMEDYQTHNQYVSNMAGLNTIKSLKERYPDLKLHETVNYRSREERDAGKQETPGILEERGGEITGRKEKATEQD